MRSFGWKADSSEARDERVRLKLVENLFSRTKSLVGEKIAGIATAATVSVLTGNPLIYLATVALTAVALGRLALAWRVSKNHEKGKVRGIEVAFEVCAYGYAIFAGLIAAITIATDAPSAVQLLAFAHALVHAVGISVGNAGRPFVAIGQVSFAVIPIIGAALLDGGAANLMLTVTLCLAAFGVASVVLGTFDTLRDQIAAADASAAMAENMRRLARSDVVTGLLNRAGLNHGLVEMLMKLREGRTLAMFWLDLDRFKEVNDTLGHPIGDRVLAEVAKRLNAQAPDGAIVSRFGGDEFVLVAEVGDRAESEHLAGALSNEVARAMRIDGRRIDISASMGVALLPDDGADIDTLMQSADLALYHAKIGRQNQICFFNNAMTRDLVRKKEIETELRAAIQRDELSIFFQPIVDLETGCIRSFEALVRWFHPEKGELKPDEFIPVAEETGLITTLGNWITAQAAKACAKWPEDVTIAVNLSPMQLLAPGAALGILNALREAGLDPSRLELEVTENLFLDDNHNTARFMEELSAVGVRFALDDFGTGYSSLHYINKFPFKKIKVDRSFVSGPNIGRKTDAIIRAVAEMGNTLDMDIVAEGLETVEQVRAVREAGCTLGQGYYFSRAVPDYLAAMLLAQEREEDSVVRRVG